MRHDEILDAVGAISAVFIRRDGTAYQMVIPKEKRGESILAPEPEQPRHPSVVPQGRPDLPNYELVRYTPLEARDSAGNTRWIYLP